MVDTRHCNKCNQDKPKEEFIFMKADTTSRNRWCKSCRSDYLKEYRSRDTYQNNQRPRALKRLRVYNLQKNYGLSEEEYNKLFNKQHGECAICGTEQKDLRHKLSVDHNHTSNKIRGLLCGKCNRGLGYFKDSKTLLNSAIKYLDESGETW